MSGPDDLAAHRGCLSSRMGAAFPGRQAVFRGRDLHAELGGLDWLELYVFGITGNRYSGDQMKLLHALWSYTSYPDARLWNNRVAALAGSARSTGALAVAAALAVSEARIYGGGPCLAAYDFLSKARQEISSGATLEQLVEDELGERRGIGGYGRPIASADERIAPIMALARASGLADGQHVGLAFQTEAVLLAGRWRLHMNYAALTAAFALDLGFQRQAYQLFMTPVFLAGMPPCYLEAAENPADTLFPLACSDLRYEGVADRVWPRAGEQCAGQPPGVSLE